MTFVITAAVKLLGWLPLLPVPWLLGDDICRCSRPQAHDPEGPEAPLLSAEQQEQQGFADTAAEPASLAAASTVPNAVAVDVRQAQAKRTRL